MKKQIKTLMQIGVVYLAVSIVLDFFLAGYPILTWAGLGFAFILFGAVIFNVILELTTRPAVNKRVRQFTKSEDDLMRLDKLCQQSLEHGDAAAIQLLFERVRSLAFAAAAYHFGITESMLRNLVQHDPSSLEQQIQDRRMFEVLTQTGSADNLRKGDFESCLAKIEDWSR